MKLEVRLAVGSLPPLGFGLVSVSVVSVYLKGTEPRLY